MHIVIAIAYILFFGIADILVYFMLNRPGQIKNVIFMGYGVFFVAVALLHTALFKLQPLMPVEVFVRCTAFLLFLIIIHYLAIRANKRLYNPANKANGDIKNVFSKFWGFISFKLFYFVFFIVQCLYVFHA